tara:strand:- start:44 stop:292 length:249 start_codon:yes stop_codon:yes gene_type:complete
VIELIKRILRLKSIDRDRGTYSATGDSLDLSDDAQASDDFRRSKGESTVRDGVSQDEIKQPIFVNEDAEYCKYLAKFFKGEK